MEKTTQYLAGGGLFAAIAVVLQFVGSAIRFGPFSVSLVLIPIVLGAALYGWGMEVLLSGTAQLPDIRLRIPDRVICGRTEESLLSGALYRAAAMTEGLAQRMEQELGCPCTLVFTGVLSRFVAPLCRREAVYDEDLLLRGLWKRCTANCPSADKP